MIRIRVDAHDLQSGNGITTRCRICGWTWPRLPREECSGVPRYYANHAERPTPVHLKTKTDLASQGLKPADLNCPDGAVYSYQNKTYYWLYDTGAAVPKRTVTPAQLAALKKARQAALDKRRTCPCCGLVAKQDLIRDRHEGDACWPCWQAAEAAKAEADALAEQKRIADDRRIAARWAKALLQRNDLVILDTETTGLDWDAEVIEIATIDRHGAVLINERVRPTVPISPEATAVHGMANKDLEAAPPFPLVHPRLSAIVSGKLIAIFNSGFDLEKIERSCRVHGLPPPWTGASPNTVCLMLLYARWCGEWSDYWGDYRYQSLPGGDHTALGDCLAALRMLTDMASDLDDEGLADQITPPGASG